MVELVRAGLAMAHAERVVASGRPVEVARVRMTDAAWTALAGDGAMTRNEYLALRHRYEPESIKLVLIAESPPTSGKYFYNAAGAPSEPLFAALMKQLRLSPMTKEAGLRQFQQRGWVLIDATYEPVDKLTDASRNSVIERDYPLLRRDLTTLLADHSIPLVLIKANVRRLLEPKLTKDGFNVINKGCDIYFPASGRQKDFHRQFGMILESHMRSN
jgi:hypothetical protein